MPRVRIDAGLPLHRKADKAIEALAEANDAACPDVMVRGDALVKLDGGSLSAFSVASLRDKISKAAQFEKETRQGPTPIDPPIDVASVVLERSVDEYDALPKVDRLVDVPVCLPGPDRPRWLSDPGLDEESGLYYAPAAGLEKAKPLAADTTEDVDWALGVFRNELFVNFNFAEQADFAHALGLLLLPFVRELIKGSTPLHAVLAPDYGAGKTWLSQAALYPGCGLVPATPQTKNEEEWRKRITSSLIGGSSAVLLDNFSGTLDSGPLAAALTSDVWQDRLLGVSKEVTLPIRNVWVITGNNLDLADEQVRRAVPLFLKPGDIRASDRKRKDFRHPDLLNWAKDNRKELVEAALTLIEHWRLGPVEEIEGGYVYRRQEGNTPRQGQQTLGSFERWAGVIGGILDAVDVGGFLGNREQLALKSASPDTHEGMEFLREWSALKRGPVKTADLLNDHCGPLGPLAPYLPTEVAKARPDVRSQALGYWLRERDGRRIGVGDSRYQPLYDKKKRAWDVRQVSATAPEA